MLLEIAKHRLGFGNSLSFPRVFMASLWWIWRFCNLFVFEGKDTTPKQALFKIKRIAIDLENYFAPERSWEKKEPRDIAVFTLRHSGILLQPPSKQGRVYQRIGNSRLLFSFYHVIDRDRVFENGPWNFDNDMLVLKIIKDNEDPETTNLDWNDMSVHIHGLSLGKMTRGIAAFIGDSIGQFRDMDLAESGGQWGSSLKIGVGINITKPLPRFMMIKSLSGDEVQVTFSYEKLGHFCYLCGVPGHVGNFCELRYSDSFIDPGLETPFGPWLRAPTRRRQSQSAYRERQPWGGGRPASSSGVVETSCTKPRPAAFTLGHSLPPQLPSPHKHPSAPSHVPQIQINTSLHDTITTSILPFPHNPASPSVMSPILINIPLQFSATPPRRQSQPQPAAA
ncbi:hypothetical protein BUALT_Bualt02G0058300 [Buddleja alternifolia]|uniref:Zinc knuckle CX2CX4HX4C domain-containing protein n=1 Tax=Buddleja alternifolia TaxID=168488 RepID=A0AAV6Y8Y5_9LAMI|nr:hypothetical protein BUALT_Bualt02G0058300 [Buddleja alternifolia]